MKQASQVTVEKQVRKVQAGQVGQQVPMGPKVVMVGLVTMLLMITKLVMEPNQRLASIYQGLISLIYR